MNELIKNLLSSMIEDGKAGIHNGVMNKNLENVRDQFDYLEKALEWLIQLENGEDIDFESFGKYMKWSVNTNDLESAINTLLLFYEETESKDNPEYGLEIKKDKELIAQLIKRIENAN